MQEEIIAMGLTVEQQEAFLAAWLEAVSADETDVTIKRHIVHHAKEIYEKTPEEWAASMRNLVDIFEHMNKISPPTHARLGKLLKKYRSNPRRYTPPPAEYF